MIRRSNSLLGLVLIAALNTVLLFAVIPGVSSRVSPLYNQERFSDGYDLLAQNLVQGNGYRFYPDTALTTMREPGYPVFLAGIMYVFGSNFFFVKLANLLLAFGVAWLMTILAGKISSNRLLAIVPPLLFLFHPATLIAESRGGVEILFTFLLMLFFVALYSAMERSAALYYLFAGLALGAAVLVRSTPMLFPFFLLAYLLVFQRQRIPALAAVGNVAIVIVAMLAVLSPWIVRNYKLTHHFIPTASVLGISAHAGEYICEHRSEPTPWYLLDRAAAHERSNLAHQLGYKFIDGYYQSFYATNDELLFSSYLAKRVFGEYESNPLLCAKCVGLNLFNFWFTGKSWTSTAINVVIQLPYLVLAAIGCIVYRKRKQFYLIAPLLLFVGYVMAVHVPILAQARYTMPLIPLLSILAAIAFLPAEVKQPELLQATAPPAIGRIPQTSAAGPGGLRHGEAIAMKRFFQFLAALIFGGLVLRAVLRQFDFSQTMTALRQANPKLFLLGVAAMVLAYLVRGARWRIWESSLSYWDSLRLILIGFMGNNVLPARLGEILRAHCTSPKIGGDRGRTAALASIGAERVLDGLVLAVFGLVGMALVPVDRRLRWSLILVSLAFAVLTLMLLLGIHQYERFNSWIAIANRKFSGRAAGFFFKKLSQLLAGILPLQSWSRMFAAVGVTTLIWGIEIVFYYLGGLAVWSGMSFRIALLLLVVVNFASLIPFTIGGIGTIEAVALTFLVSSGVSPYAALAMILLQHASQYFFTTISGGILYLAGGFYGIPLAGKKIETAALSAPIVTEPVIEQTRSSLGQLGEVVELKPAPRGEIELSIVIPAYNEQSRLPRTVLEAIRWCTSKKMNFELIISDDGSRDETLELARLFEESDMRIRALACPHLGKGAAVRMGILNARGEKVLFMDADGATPMAEIPKLIAAIESGNDVAIGSRAMNRGEVEIKTPFYRKAIGRVFAFFVGLFAIDGIADTQCGFKMFRRDAARAIFSRQKTIGFAFDVEILYIARHLSLSIAEIPVNWTAQAGSKVNLVTDSIKMLWDISHIRWLQRNADFRRNAVARVLPGSGSESEVSRAL